MNDNPQCVWLLFINRVSSWFVETVALFFVTCSSLAWLQVEQTRSNNYDKGIFNFQSPLQDGDRDGGGTTREDGDSYVRGDEPMERMVDR